MSDLDDMMTYSLWWAMYTGSPQLVKPAYPLMPGFAFRVDSAVRSYNAARAELMKYVSHPIKVKSIYYRSIDHLEHCVNSAYRAIRFGRALRSHGRLVRADQTPLVPKRLTVLSDSVFRRLGTIRNAMEHIENDVIKGIAVGTVTLTVKADSIELGGEEIWYSELAQWIRDLHEISRSLVDYHS